MDRRELPNSKKKKCFSQKKKTEPVSSPRAVPSTVLKHEVVQVSDGVTHTSVKQVKSPRGPRGVNKSSPRAEVSTTEDEGATNNTRAGLDGTTAAEGGESGSSENEETKEISRNKDGNLEDIIQYIGENLDELDPNIRTIVHGFENKVRTGEIARVLQPKNEKNWMLLEVMGKEAHWVPSWVVSKGYYKV